MLEAVRKEFWKADADTVKQLAKTHAELMKKFNLPPTRNEKLREMIRKNLQDPELRKAYEQQIAKMLEQQRRVAAARKKADEVSGRKLKEQTIVQPMSESKKRSALMIVAGIVILAILSIFLGNRRKRNSL